MLKVVDETPEFDQGETDENPRPAPNASKSSDKAAAATPPARMAPQDTPEALASLPASAIVGAVVCASMAALPRRQRHKGSLMKAADAQSAFSILPRGHILRRHRGAPARQGSCRTLPMGLTAAGQ